MDLTNDDSDLPTDVSDDAHQIALELMKQIITLASGVVALSATFLEKLNIGTLPMLILGLSWSALIVSILYGLQAISAIVKSRLNSTREWSRGRGQNFARTSKYAFVTGISLFALFALSLFVLTQHPESTYSSSGHWPFI
jgi:hypothetical protein